MRKSGVVLGVTVYSQESETDFSRMEEKYINNPDSRWARIGVRWLIDIGHPIVTTRYYYVPVMYRAVVWAIDKSGVDAEREKELTIAAIDMAVRGEQANVIVIDGDVQLLVVK